MFYGNVFGGLFDPKQDARLRALNQEPTGVLGQAGSFAASEAQRVQSEKDALAQAKAAAQKAQDDAAAEVDRQQKLQDQQRADALNLAQQKLQQDNFQQQQDIQNRQFEANYQLQLQQEAMQRAQQQGGGGSGGSQRGSGYGQNAPMGNVFSDLFYTGPQMVNGLDAYRLQNKLSQSLGTMFSFDPSRGQFYSGTPSPFGDYKTSGSGVLSYDDARMVANAPHNTQFVPMTGGGWMPQDNDYLYGM